MEELKIWLEAQREIPLEGMDEFYCHSKNI